MSKEKVEVKEKVEKIEEKHFSGEIKRETLLEYLRNIKPFIDELKITINKNGLSVKQTDKAMVCLIDLQLAPDYFYTFDLKGKEIKICVNSEFLTDVIKKAHKGDFLKLEYHKTKDNEEFWIKYDNTEWKIPLLEFGEEELPNVDELKPTTSFEVHSETLKKAIEYGLLVGECLTIECNSNVVAKTEGDVAKVITELETTYDGKEARAKYPLDYLRKLKFKSTYIKISFGTDYPMILQDDDFKFILAPRVYEE